MPRESKPDIKTWKAKIAKELEALHSRVILVGHSVGGAALLKYLAEENVEKQIAGLFLLAAPSLDEEDWNFDDLRLPRDLAAKLLRIPQIFLYHNRDDEIVPFSHLALHAARLPRAIVREGDKGGHQFGNDLANIANDIKGVAQASDFLRVGQVFEITFPRFTPRITIQSERELKVEILSGDNAGFTDTVEYEATTIRDGLVILSWKEHIGSTVVSAFDLTANQAHTFVTPAKGEFMRLTGPIKLKPSTYAFSI
jgi:predicted alpha/beta hydrolase family esterase